MLLTVIDVSFYLLTICLKELCEVKGVDFCSMLFLLGWVQVCKNKCIDFVKSITSK